MFIWVPRFVEEVKGRRGLFEVKDSLGKKLIDEGLAQDPQLGAAALDPITDEPAVRKVVRKRRTKKVSEESVEAPEESKPAEAPEELKPAEADLLDNVPADES